MAKPQRLGLKESLKRLRTFGGDKVEKKLGDMPKNRRFSVFEKSKLHVEKANKKNPVLSRSKSMLIRPDD